jgi:quercetin dioxygenase-like cupin family protein
MPVLAVGGERSFGPMMAVVMRAAANDVREAIVPGSGHWVMEENPAATIGLITDFLALPRAPEVRLAPAEFDFGAAHAGGTGTSGVSGIQTIVLKGDPDRPGLYTIMLRVPPHTRIAAHNHADDRIATVVSGTWYFGYGREFDAKRLRALPTGSFYTEPQGAYHFAETRDSAVLVQITGFGPSSTTYAVSRSAGN